MSLIQKAAVLDQEQIPPWHNNTQGNINNYLRRCNYRVSKRLTENMVRNLINNVTPQAAPTYPGQISLAESYRAATARVLHANIMVTQSGYSKLASSTDKHITHLKCYCNKCKHVVDHDSWAPG